MKNRKSALTPKLRQNWWIDALLGIGALLAVLSSVYFLVYPVSGYQGGRNPDYNKVLVFTRVTWDLIHTWSGVVMTMTAILHFALHWQWITTITKKIFKRQHKEALSQTVTENTQTA